MEMGNTLSSSTPWMVAVGLAQLSIARRQRQTLIRVGTSNSELTKVWLEKSTVLAEKMCSLRIALAKHFSITVMFIDMQVPANDAYDAYE